jgi:hypothetical protein
LAVPEMFVEKVIEEEVGGGKGEVEEPRRRRGDPRFEKNEKVWIKSRYGHDGIFTWQEGDPMRPATIELVAVRGRGVKQEVEYDVR